MNQFDAIQEFLEHAEDDSSTPDGLAAPFIDSLAALGFRYFACCSHVDPIHPPPEAVMLHNYPPGWVRTFSEAKLYRIDPVLERAASNPKPFFWDTGLPPESLTRAQRLILAEAAGYGLQHGYTMPLHLSWLPGTLRASCSVIPDGGRVDPRNYLAVQILAIYLYFYGSRMRAPWLAATHTELTPRELECLVLVAQGHEDGAIARKLGVGVATVHSHIEELKYRLGACTRAQAVAQALMSGQLTFAELARGGKR